MYGAADLADLVTVRHLSNDPAWQLLGQDPPHWLARAGLPHPWSTSAAMTLPPSSFTARTIGGFRSSSRGEWLKACHRPAY